MNFKTVLGDIAYDKKGDITKLDYVMYIWKKDDERQDHLRRVPGRRLQVKFAATNAEKPAYSMAGFLLADLAQRRERFQQPEAHLVEAAGEERDAGEHQQRAHRLLDAVQIAS